MPEISRRPVYARPPSAFVLIAATLTTFSGVPWNAPLYRHLGFGDLVAAEIGPRLRSVLGEETAHGLDPAARTCMRLGLSG
jgi:hypothetical protein